MKKGTLSLRMKEFETVKRKAIVSLILCVCTVFVLFVGCKIETPDEVAGVTASTLFGSDSSSASEEASPSDGSTSDTLDEETVSAPDSSMPAEETPSTPQDSSSASNSSPDPYQTEPVPEGKPQPVEPQDQNPDQGKVRYCTLSVECKTILDNIDALKKEKLSVLPEDGVIFAERQVVFYEGESVFDVLNREMKKNRIHMEFRATPIYNSNYIAGIHNLYEFDCGDLSGWMYSVNGWYPNYGCSRYEVKEGDVIRWNYTCDLGRDLGAEMPEGQGGQS